MNDQPACEDYSGPPDRRVMLRCADCKQMYERRPGGDILLPVCYECRAKPPEPPAYIERNGVLMPNPDSPHPPRTDVRRNPEADRSDDDRAIAKVLSKFAKHVDHAA